MPNVFSVPIFFIVFRETLEAVIIISVLLGIVEQIANTRLAGDSLPATETENEKQNIEGGATPPLPLNDDASSDDGERKKLLRKLRIQVCQGPLPSRIRGSEVSDQTSSCRPRAHVVPCAGLDFHWLCSGVADCSCYWRGVHCCLVHSSFGLVEKV